MRLVPTPVASQLTGLSTEKLREWTSRRALVPADVRPRQKGSPARFSWRTILILRLALLLRDQFGVELQFHKENFAKLRKELRTASFIALWGRRLALTSQGELLLLDDQAPLPAGDAIFIRLDPTCQSSGTDSRCLTPRRLPGNWICSPSRPCKL